MVSAYIAASRRSDRSLEARVESARRASEIHKRRTGRSLRVTEQDVVNEEMYEEEDDDLPVQYRRLTAHLQTGSADFNRRLSNYLTNHVAMRSALDQAITNAYAQQYPNAPQFAHNQSNYPSPFSPQSMKSQPSSKSYQPYPTPGTQGYRPGHAARSASMSQTGSARSPSMQRLTPISMHGTPQIDHRRMSGSVKSLSRSPPTPSSAPAVPQAASMSQLQASPPLPTTQPNGMQQMRARSLSFPQQLHHPNHQMQPNAQHLQEVRAQAASRQQDITPLTTSLPTESQMLLGSTLDPNDPTTAALMAGSENIPMPFDNGGSSHRDMKIRGFNQPFEGMSTTLAPSALDMAPHNHNFNLSQNGIGMNSHSTPGLPLSFEGSLTDFSKGQHYFASGNSSGGSGAGTPGGDANWEAFINDASWAENPT